MCESISKEENIKYQLETLTAYEGSDIESNEIEVGYEDSLGGDAWITVDITKLAEKALARIVVLEDITDELEDKIEGLEDIILELGEFQ